MPVQHLLNLITLADADVDGLALVRFTGREALSEAFDYALEVAGPDTIDVRRWIGKACEFSVTLGDGRARVFAGRIYETGRVIDGGGCRLTVRVRPAWHAASYARATDFIQDKSSRDIFEAMAGDVPGLVTTLNLSPAPPVRGYAVRIDESERDFLARLLAEDGITFFFRHDKSALYKHRMVLTNGTSSWFDCIAGAIPFHPNSEASGLASLGQTHRGQAQSRQHHAFNVNKLDTPFSTGGSAAPSWSHVLPHADESIGAEAVAAGDLSPRATARGQGGDSAVERYGGSSDWPELEPGGRFELKEQPSDIPRRLLVVAVDHSAFDPSGLPEGGRPSYANNWVAVDAAKPFRPPVSPRKAAPGPVLGVVKNEKEPAGQVVVDKQSRIPVQIPGVHATAGVAKPFPLVVWLPVRQQWSHATHGAQFLPRVGAHVIVDFLYGNPDLPFVSGCIYTPSQAYPFDTQSQATRSGWRSVTDKNGSIRQEFLFEDKPGKEEVYLYTGRDYRRVIDNDDWGTIKRDQTLEVGRDQAETIKRNQTETVKKDRTATVEGKEAITVRKTRTVKVTQKNLLESNQEIELKVGGSSIKMTPTGIVIKAVKIEIKADAMLDVSAGGKAGYKAPMTEVSADAVLILKGGVVMIN